MGMPRITVVTPSYNQGRFIARTIESVRDQGYPNLEHIVVDGMSTDETPAILARYPHLRVVREPDNGQADAINKGFRLATGDIFCFLNSDDMLMPQALERVAREIDPGRGRHIVFGRSCHIDEHDRRIHIEHPCGYVNHRRVLEFWKEHCIPQPSTFWTADVWRRCGPLSAQEPQVLDYDLFCRFSQHYQFHFIDQVLARYRLHAESKTCTRDFPEVYREALRVSRSYWGPRTQPQFWQLCGSLAWHRIKTQLQKLRRKHWAARLVDEYQRARGNGNDLLGLAALCGAATFAPDLVFRRLVQHRISRHVQRYLPPPRGEDQWHLSRTRPLTLAWRGYTDIHSGNFLGPLFVTHLPVGPEQRCLELHVEGIMDPLPWPMDVEVFLDGRLIQECRGTQHLSLDLQVPLSHWRRGQRELQIVSSSFLVPHDYLGNCDFRPLSLKVKRFRVVAAQVAHRRQAA
jgi:glycosyltransferase involved in cell wall biosynthesis